VVIVWTTWLIRTGPAWTEAALKRNTINANAVNARTARQRLGVFLGPWGLREFILFDTTRVLIVHRLQPEFTFLAMYLGYLGS
jgi:hypothetical protein